MMMSDQLFQSVEPYVASVIQSVEIVHISWGSMQRDQLMMNESALEDENENEDENEDEN